jgi:hypothetical protein
MEQDLEASSLNKCYLQINGKEAAKQLLASRGGKEERLRRLLAGRGGKEERQVVVPVMIWYPIDNHLELKRGWDCGLPSARCRQGDGVPAEEGWPPRPPPDPPYAADPRAHHVAAKFAAAFFSDRRHGQLKRQEGAILNLQIGGPLPRASPELPPVCCQVLGYKDLIAFPFRFLGSLLKIASLSL